MESKKTMSLSVVNAFAAGIDVGSREHYVAVGQNQEDVRVFKVYSQDNDQMVKHLKACGIKTVSMESTGTY